MNKTKNLLDFLHYINQHKKFCIKELSANLDISLRTLQRYKKEIQEYFGIEFIQVSKGCYVLSKPLDLDSFWLKSRDFEDYERFIDFLQLTNSSFLNFLGFDPSLIIKKNEEIYFLKESPFEELINFELLKKIKNVIYRKKIVDIYYHSDKAYFFSEAKPLKIVYAENNWYLAVLTDDKINNGFKFLRINFIKDIKEYSKTFKTPPKVKEFFKTFQTLFTSFDEPFYEVIVKVDKEVARHFKVKKFLSSQKILQELEDGSLKISYKINNENEILLLAKRWLPFVKIESPKELQDKLIKIVKTFLNDKN